MFGQLTRLLRIGKKAKVPAAAHAAVCEAPVVEAPLLEAAAAEAAPTAPDPFADSLLRSFTWPFQFLRDQLIEIVGRHTKEEIETILAHDKLLRNLALNHWEYLHGVTHCSSYPWQVVIPISDACNASCTFCDSWLRGKRTLKMEELERFAPVLGYAAVVSLVGHGEPLIHPHFKDIAMRIKELVDPRCHAHIITNGFKLQEHLDDLLAVGVNVYNVSLNAATAETHDRVMALGETAFDKIIASLRHLRAIQESGTFFRRIGITLSFVVTADNMHEIPAFIELGNELDVCHLNIRPLAPQRGLHPGLNYHALPPYQRSDFAEQVARARSAIAASRIPVNADIDTWSQPVFPPTVELQIRENPPPVRDRETLKVSYKDAWGPALDWMAEVKTRGGKSTIIPDDPVDDPFRNDARKPHYQCWDVYAILHMNDFFFMLRPCCYMDVPPGYDWNKYDGTYDFMEAWNSPGMVELRRRLRDGKLFTMCTKCPEQKQYPVPVIQPKVA